MIHAVESKPVVVKGIIQQVNECKRLFASTMEIRELAPENLRSLHRFRDSVGDGLRERHEASEKIESDV